jgi:thiamine pyrophosphate-dependent acetolactate synthase large subunit-like protein
MSDPKLNRSNVMKKLMAVRGDALAIAGLGSPVWDLASSDHKPENFYLWGGMGCAVSMGLGCALAQPDRGVWVITGDGEALMGVGSFATVGIQRPRNLVVIVLDNEHYGETGMQRTATSHGTDIAAMAAAAGVPTTMKVTDDAGVDALVKALKAGSGPLVAVVKVAASKPNLVLPSRDGVYLKNRFRQAVLGATDAMHVS